MPNYGRFVTGAWQRRGEMARLWRTRCLSLPPGLAVQLQSLPPAGVTVWSPQRFPDREARFLVLAFRPPALRQPLRRWGRLSLTAPAMSSHRYFGADSSAAWCAFTTG